MTSQNQYWGRHRSQVDEAPVAVLLVVQLNLDAPIFPAHAADVRQRPGHRQSTLVHSG
jgi:hypothetical protein